MSGSSGAYLWNFSPQLEASNDQDSYTVEYGDDSQAWECPFVVCMDLDLSVTLDDIVKVRAGMVGREATRTSFTPSLDDEDVTEVVANDLKIYIDDTWGAIGTAQKDSLLVGASIKLPSGLATTKYADGRKDFSNVRENSRHHELELEMTIGTDGLAELSAYDNQTLRAIRLQFEGPAIESGYDNLLTVDMLGYYTSEPELFGVKNGENVYRLTLSSIGVGSDEELAVQVQNSISTI